MYWSRCLLKHLSLYFFTSCCYVTVVALRRIATLCNAFLFEIFVQSLLGHDNINECFIWRIRIIVLCFAPSHGHVWLIIVLDPAKKASFPLQTFCDGSSIVSQNTSVGLELFSIASRLSWLMLTTATTNATSMLNWLEVWLRGIKHGFFTFPQSSV